MAHSGHRHPDLIDFERLASSLTSLRRVTCAGDRLPGLVSDLVRRQVNVIMGSNTPAVVAAKAATATIPIAFLTASEPRRGGIRRQPNRPGGNLTGVTFLGVEIGRKHFELMREVVPTAATIAFLLNPTNRTLAGPLTRDAQAAARSLGLKLHVL
jgi:putative tryptophan/tyrosine transport system substrate-binding protein